MPSFCRLQINCDNLEIQEIEKILGKANSSVGSGWNFVINEGCTSLNAALEQFVFLISENLDALKSINISMNQVTIWYMYEYEGQCNMEFSPDITARLGKLGVFLCISCWEK